MKKLTSSLAVLSALLIPLLSGCTVNSDSNPSLPNPGFTLITQRRNSLGIESPMPSTIVEGKQRRPLPPEATGTVRDFRDTSSPTVGLLPVPGGVAPAFWAIGVDNGPCAGQVAFGGVKRADYNYLTCTQLRLSFPFAFVPFSLTSSDMAHNWTVTGDGMSTSYGMPVLQVYDGYGNVVAQMMAMECGYAPETDAAPETTWMSGTCEGLWGLPSGTYTADIFNQTPDGEGAYVGFVSFTIVAEQPPPGPCSGYEYMGGGCETEVSY